MRKPDPVEQAMDRLNAVRVDPDAEHAALELRLGLRHKSNLVAARAAKLAAQMQLRPLVPDLIAAFDRFFANPPKLDKACAAITEIAGALHELDYTEPDIYRRGIHYVQMEGSFGPPIDVAAKLRGLCALGLVRTHDPDALFEVLPLLTDSEPHARLGAIRALAALGGDTAALLLRLKVQTGDNDSDVLAECFTALLAADRSRSLTFVAKFMEDEDESVAEAAILALGGSRHPAALDVLRKKWQRTPVGPLRKILLLSIGTVRTEEAAEFLVSLLDDANITTAKEVIAALSMYRGNEQVSAAVETALAGRRSPELLELFRGR